MRLKIFSILAMVLVFMMRVIGKRLADYKWCTVAVDGPKRTKSYIDEVYRLLEEKPGVEDILIMNRSGVPIKTSMERQDALQHACLYENLREKCQAFLSKMEPPQLLTMLRVRTRLHEVLLTPDGKITVLVVQNPKDTHLKVQDLNSHSSNF